MITNPIEIDVLLREIIKEHLGPLKVRKDDSTGMEVAGTIPTMQGKQQVDGFYFASVIPKPKDTRLYFFPIYTDVVAFEDLPSDLRKCLKGKSCFHFKKIDNDLKTAITEMIAHGVIIYQEKGLLTMK